MKNKLYLIIGLIVLVLVLSIGGTYAWFSTRVEGTGAKVTLVTDELKLIYTDTLAISDAAIQPGWSVTKTFTVENTTNEERYYKIVWKDLVNTFVNTDDLTITITSTNGGGNLEKTPIQSSSTPGNYDIIPGVTIAGKTVQEYTVTFEYANTTEDQSADMGKTFSGSIEIQALESEYQGPYLYRVILADNPNVETRTDFSTMFTESNNGNTIYKASGQDGEDTYYFAGTVTNNYVKFGTNSEGQELWWRIVRINEDNSVRLIYAGISAEDTSAFISTSQEYITKANNSSYVGYMYTRSQQYGTNTNSSIKTVVDNWYSSNLNSYSGYISKTAIYCNDRTVASGYTWSATRNTFYYAARETLQTNKTPTFACSNANDRFTASTSTGNGKLTYPIGLITADEISYAGGVYGTHNSNYYIAQNASSGASWWWTMSPYHWDGNDVRVFIVGGSGMTGNLSRNYVGITYGVRPVISLKSCVLASGGSGTANNPYTVELAGGCADVENEILEDNTVRVSATTNDTNMATVNAPSSVIISSGSSYTFTFTVNGGYKYESVTGCDGTYDTSTRELTINNVTSNTTCQVNFISICEEGTLCHQILADNPNLDTRTDFSTIFTESNNGNTIYSATGQDNKTTYYFAGAVTNNYVKFGTNSEGQELWWRIVRINEDHSVRLIYAGVSATDTTPVIATKQVFNSNYKNSSYVGYMYTLGQQHGLSRNSTIKTAVDNWYADNLNSYSGYISKTAIYCNDRTVGEGTWSATGSRFAYAPSTRFTTFSPSFTCNNVSDRFTVSASTGNGKLTYPIGLMTTDEIMFAGAAYDNPNDLFYLSDNIDEAVTQGWGWWTMSPGHWVDFITQSYVYGFDDTPGEIFAAYVDGMGNDPEGALSIRPVISLKSCVLFSGGNGTANNPYTVELPSACSSAVN